MATPVRCGLFAFALGLATALVTGCGGWDMSAKRPPISPAAAPGLGSAPAPGARPPGRTSTAASAVALTASSSSTVSIQVVGVPTPQGVLVNYLTAPANKPKTFNNQLYVWDTTDNQVPWGKDPEGSTGLTSDASTATRFLPFDYEDKGYIVGYAVAAETAAVCSTIYIPQGASGDPTKWKYASVGLLVVYSDSSVVQVQYTVLPAYKPAARANWVAVWQGSSVPYEGESLGQANIPSDAETGYAVIEGLGLTINTPYSVGYFMVAPGSGRTTLAAQATFTIGATK